jgi:hypothetical protein
MPRAWIDKDERQYEHIRDSELERGKPPARAKEIAARTVNAQRRKEGRTPNQTTPGTGNPNRSYEERRRRELYNRARELGGAGRSSMTKEELIEALRRVA